MAVHDEDMSRGLGSAGEELMDVMQIVKVVKDKQPGDLRLEHGGLDLDLNVVSGFDVVW